MWIRATENQIHQLNQNAKKLFKNEEYNESITALHSKLGLQERLRDSGAWSPTRADIEIQQTLSLIAKAEFELSDYVSASEYAQKSLRLLRDVYGDHFHVTRREEENLRKYLTATGTHSNIVDLVNEINQWHENAKTLFRNKNYKESIATFQEVLRKQDQLRDSGWIEILADVEIQTIQSSIAKARFELADYAGAVHHARLSLKLLRDEYGSDFHLTKQEKEALEEYRVHYLYTRRTPPVA